MAASALKNDVFTLVIVLILLVAGTFLFSRNKFQNLLFPAGHIKRTPTIPANAKTEDVAVSGSNFTFTPKEITVTKGNKIKITFKNTGGEHNFTIPDLN